MSPATTFDDRLPIVYQDDTLVAMHNPSSLLVHCGGDACAAPQACEALS